jgi:hypothetical protein
VTEWATTIVLAVVLFIIGFVISWLWFIKIKRK